jgi:hypothetical protein
MDELEILWGGLLSRDPAKVRATWGTLSAEEQEAVRAHLVRMATEEGWTRPQRVSAQAALNALRNWPEPDQTEDADQHG